MASSWLDAAASLGFELRIASPDGYAPPQRLVDRAAAAGARVTLTRDPHPAAAGAHVVTTDVWASMGEQAEAGIRRRDFAGYTVDAAVMDRARPDAIFLHCLPAHRGEEATDDVLDGSGAVSSRKRTTGCTPPAP